MKIVNCKLKIVFFGTSAFAVPALEALVASGMSPVAVVTAPDKPAGRGRKMTASPVKAFLTSHVSTPSVDNLILQPEKLDISFFETIAELKPDFGVVASYGKILPRALLDLFPRGILNIHPSLLPLYRGSSPIQTTILNGDTKTGVTIMLMDEKMDHGPILAQKELTSPPNPLSFVSRGGKKTYQELHDELAKLGANLLVETLPKYLDGKITPIPQDDAKATYTKMIKKEDGLIDWSRDAEYIERMVRAYNPWPSAYAKLKNGKILKIKKAEVVDGKLVPLVVQPEGKKEMPADAYLRGNQLFL